MVIAVKVQGIIDKLAKDLADSIDNEVLYTSLGWTIVDVPIKYRVNDPAIEKWLEENSKHYCYWDGRVAFAEDKDVTMFLLKWL